MARVRHESSGIQVEGYTMNENHMGTQSKTTKRRHLLAAAVAAALGGSLAPNAMATTYTWLGGTGLWSDTTQWAGGIKADNNSANVAATDLVFNGSSAGTPVPYTSTIDFTSTTVPTPPVMEIHNLTFQANDNLTHTIAANAGTGLGFRSQATISQNGSSSFVITAPVSFNTTPATYQQTGSGTLTLAGL